MATYKEIKGFNIKSLAADPSTLLEGDIWYNSTSGTLKTAQPFAAAWAAGGNMSSQKALNGAGTQTATLGMGGYFNSAPPGNYQTNEVEEYNGSSWTSKTAMANDIFLQSATGTVTSALSAGGNRPPGGGPTTNTSEEYDGSSWTAGGNINTARRGLVGVGTQTATVAFSGDVNPGYSALTEEYNGASWTVQNTLTTARTATTSQGAGTQTAALCCGGMTGSATNVVEEYNGASWSASPAMPRNFYFGMSGGTTADAFAVGGETTAGSGPTVQNTTVMWNGTAWAADAATLGTARYQGGGSGTGPAGLCFGGATGTNVKQTATEEYTAAYIGAKTVTTS